MALRNQLLVNFLKVSHSQLVVCQLLSCHVYIEVQLLVKFNSLLNSLRVYFIETLSLFQLSCFLQQQLFKFLDSGICLLYFEVERLLDFLMAWSGTFGGNWLLFLCLLDQPFVFLSHLIDCHPLSVVFFL